MSLPSGLVVFAQKRGKNDSLRASLCLIVKKGTLPNADARKANVPLAGQKTLRTF